MRQALLLFKDHKYKNVDTSKNWKFSIYCRFSVDKFQLWECFGTNTCIYLFFKICIFLAKACEETWFISSDRSSYSGGDLLRSVLHIKFGDKIKSHRYLDKSGWLGLIYCSNYRDHWRLLLFELETKILWLLKSVCHTVTLKFVHASGPI